MSRQLVITTKSWHSLIESLKGNSKHGYSSLESLKHDGVYYTAVLCQDVDEFYVARLKVIIGTETDIEEYVDFLAATKGEHLAPFSSVQMVVEEPVQTEVVETKIKRVRKPKESKL